MQNLGTLVSATPRVEKDGSILMELQIEQSRLADVPFYDLKHSTSFMLLGHSYGRFIVHVPALLEDVQVFFSTATRRDGGWEISGHKIFGSLSPVWTLGGFHAMDSSDPANPVVVHGFLPRGADGYQIIDTWDTLGMRATQSQDTVLFRTVPGFLFTFDRGPILLGGGSDPASIHEGQQIATAVRQRQVKEYIQRVRVAGAQLHVTTNVDANVAAITRAIEFARREQADVLVSPRLSGHNTPMKLYSYLAAGKAVLATRIRSHTQVLSDDDALLVEPTPTAVARALDTLLRSPLLRERLALAARRLATTRYSVTQFRASVANAYRRFTVAPSGSA